MKTYTLECCVDSVESAIEAEAGGATRLELCQCLPVGGLTPTPALYRAVRSAVSLPVRVLLRPRAGDFLYTEAEFEILLAEARAFRELGADGIVIGCLTAQGMLDIPRMTALMRAAEGLPATLSRAFDVCADPLPALCAAQELGIGTILTSGCAADAASGIDMLCTLSQWAQDIEVMAGAGVDARVIEQLLARTSITSFHMSGKRRITSGMINQNPGVPMGLPGLGEDVYRTDREAVRAARAALDAWRER